MVYTGYAFNKNLVNGVLSHVNRYNNTWLDSIISKGTPNYNISATPSYNTSAASTPHTSLRDRILPKDHFTPQSVAERDAIRSDKKSSFDFNDFTGYAGVVDFLGNAYNSFLYGRSYDDILADAGTVNRSVNGINYLTTGNIDGDREMKEVRAENASNILKTAASGAAIGSVAGPGGALIGAGIGTLVGGIGSGFRSKSAEDAISRAYMLANNKQVYDNGVAMTKGMQMDFMNRLGNPEDLRLHADAGIDSYRTNKMNNVKLTLTKDGPQFASHNAYGKGGEVIGNPEDGLWDVILGDKKDNKPLHMENGDSVITDKFGLAEAAIPSVIALKQVQGAMKYLLAMADNQKNELSRGVANNVIKKQMQELSQKEDMHNDRIANILGVLSDLRDLGLLDLQLPHAKNGLNWGNVIAGISGMATGIGLFIQASGQKVKRPSTYAANPYENRALNILGGLRADSKAIYDKINEEDAAFRYRMDNAGGISAGLRYLGKIAGALNTQLAKAQAAKSISDLDNQYKSQYANAMALIGATAAQRMTAANQWDLDYHSKAHAARLQGREMGLYNWLNLMQQYIAGVNKLHMYEGMHNLYASTLTDELRKIWNQLQNGTYKTTA